MNNLYESQGTQNQPLAFAKRFEQAGEKSKAARFYRLAGENAFRAYANDEAIKHFHTALALSSEGQLENRYSLRFMLDRVYALSSQPKNRSQNLTNLAVLADTIDDDQKRADVAARLALYKLDMGENEDVLSIARLAVRIAQIANATEAEASLHLLSGRALQRLGELKAAKSKFQQALAFTQAHALLGLEADSYRYMGVVHEECGQYAQAKSFYNQALALYQSLNNQLGYSNVLNNLGKVAYEQGEYTIALSFLEQAKLCYLTIGDQPGICRLLINQGAICTEMGDYGQAEAYNNEAINQSRNIGLRFGECMALINLAFVQLYQDKLESAYNQGQQALNLATKMGSKRLEGYAHSALGKTLKAQGQFLQADSHYWQALAIWNELEQPNLRIEAEAGLADTALIQGEMSQARLHVNKIVAAHEQGQSLDGTESPFSIFWTCYQVLTAINDSRAISLLQEAQDRLRERADKIADETFKKLFLGQVVIHHLIMNEVSIQPH